MELIIAYLGIIFFMVDSAERNERRLAKLCFEVFWKMIENSDYNLTAISFLTDVSPLFIISYIFFYCCCILRGSSDFSVCGKI